MKDVVCGMDVSTDSRFHTIYGSEKYYFCSEHCLHTFSANPKKFIEVKKWSTQKTQESKGKHQDIIYTCPMHPEIQQVGPGNCPKCGMALEPMDIVTDEMENDELKDMTQRFKISAVLTFPLFVLSMTADLIPAIFPSDLCNHGAGG